MTIRASFASIPEKRDDLMYEIVNSEIEKR